MNDKSGEPIALDDRAPAPPRMSVACYRQMIEEVAAADSDPADYTLRHFDPITEAIVLAYVYQGRIRRWSVLSPVSPQEAPAFFRDVGPMAGP